MINAGLLYEVKAKLLLLEKGFSVSEPMCASSKYDLIVDNGERLFKVQVKKTSRKNSKTSYRCRLHSTSGNKVKKYKKNEVDMFVIYIEPLDIWYVVPFDDVEGKHEITVNPDLPLYEAYSNAWLLFNEST